MANTDFNYIVRSLNRSGRVGYANTAAETLEEATARAERVSKIDGIKWAEVIDIYTDETVERFKAKNEEQLLKDLQDAREYSYTANMGDYSMSSIKDAQEQVQVATQALKDAGFEVPTW